jgi:NitT/TauT family transport system ATP-binding protein
MSKSINLSQVSKIFRGQSILHSLSFAVQEGDFVGFVGPSGCGKSTVLSLIAGLLTPTEGEVSHTFSRKKTSFVFQEASLMPWHNVEKNIALPLELMGENTKQIKEKVWEKMRLFALQDVGSFYPSALSGGMKMRTALAQALVSDPELLLLDEPFSALDEILRERCMEEVYQIWKQRNLTAVLVTHSIEEALLLCGTVFVLSQRPAKILDTVQLNWGAEMSLLEKKKSSIFLESQQKIRDLLETCYE